MSVASKRLSGPSGVPMVTTTVGTAVRASAAAVRRAAGERQALLALSIKNYSPQPQIPRSHQHV